MAALDRAEPLANPTRMSQGGLLVRTLRLSLVGMVTLALLGGVGSVGVLGQNEDATVQMLHVTGTETFVSFTPGDTQMVGDVEQMRGASAVHTVEMSDPRLSGTLTVSVDLDEYPPGDFGVQWGTYRLENEAGAWAGQWSGVFWTPPDGGGGGHSAWDLSAWAVGEGDYEGLT